MARAPAHLLVGNLDCEVEWARGPALPAAIVQRLALLATTLRVFAADDDDILWLPRAIDPDLVPRDDAPLPRLTSGAVPADTAVLAWGATARCAAAPCPVVGATCDWRGMLGALPLASVEIARQVNDRRFALAIARELGVALPGTCVIESVDALRAHLAAGGADASPTGAWVAKAPLTAAGRDRVRRTGATLDDATAVRLGRLLAIHGALLFEPWMDRTLDVGIGGVVVGSDRALVLPPHRAICDASGVIRAIAVDDGAVLATDERVRLVAVAHQVASSLGAAGYVGPFVVDAWRHRGGFHPLGEINARLTFGLVARAWSAHRGEPATLGLGGPPPPHATPLVFDPAGGPPAAWLAPLPGA